MSSMILHRERAAGHVVELFAVFDDKDVGNLPFFSVHHRRDAAESINKFRDFPNVGGALAEYNAIKKQLRNARWHLQDAIVYCENRRMTAKETAEYILSLGYRRPNA